MPEASRQGAGWKFNMLEKMGWLQMTASVPLSITNSTLISPASGLTSHGSKGAIIWVVEANVIELWESTEMDCLRVKSKVAAEAASSTRMKRLEPSFWIDSPIQKMETVYRSSNTFPPTRTDLFPLELRAALVWIPLFGYQQLQ